MVLLSVGKLICQGSYHYWTSPSPLPVICPFHSIHTRTRVCLFMQCQLLCCNSSSSSSSARQCLISVTSVDKSNLHTYTATESSQCGRLCRMTCCLLSQSSASVCVGALLLFLVLIKSTVALTDNGRGREDRQRGKPESQTEQNKTQSTEGNKRCPKYA